MIALRRLAAAGVAAAILASCTGDDSATSTSATERADSSTSALPTSSTTASCEAPGPELVRPEFDRIVTVFLFCGRGVYPVDLVAVDRVVPDDGAPLRAAINQLLIGEAPAEAAAGLSSAFSSFTASQVRGATIENGIATLDFTSGFETTNNFGTTNLSSVVYSQLDATVFQFDEITGLEFEVEGQRWCGWENICDDEPVPLRERP